MMVTKKKQPAGTNNEKKTKPRFWNPDIVVYDTAVKLSMFYTVVEFIIY